MRVNPGRITLALLCTSALLAAGCGPELPLSAPQWSPRGDRAAFVRYTPEVGSLYLVDPAAGDEPRLVEKGVERFAFSSGGAKILYLRPAPEDGKKGGALVSLDVYGTEIQKDVPKTLLSAEKGAEFRNLMAAAGGKVYLEKSTAAGKRLLVEFDPATGKTEALKLEEPHWILLPGAAGGKPAAILMRDDKTGVELLRKTLPDGKPAAVGAVKGEGLGSGDLRFLGGNASSGELILWVDEKERRRELLLVTSRGGKPAVRRYKLPVRLGEEKGQRIPLAACFAADGAKAFFSLLLEGRSEADRVLTEAWELDVKSGKARKLSEARGRLVGCPGFARGGGKRLEFTAGGLALLQAGSKTPARFWPLTIAERSDAARAFLKAKRADRALALVSTALNKARASDDWSALYVLKSEVLAAAGKPKEAANAYLESLLRYPVTAEARDDRLVAKKLRAWSDAQPGHRILMLVAQAYKHRAAGKYVAAARSFKEAASFSGDRAWAAGLMFGCAVNLFEAGKGAAAGPIFRNVSKTGEFPQADWAAGLCVIAYAIGGRGDMAAEEIQRCTDRYANSILIGDFRALATTVRSRARKARTLENVAGAGGSAARIEARPASFAHVSLVPREVAGVGKRRLALVNRDLYRVVLAPKNGPQRALLDRVPLKLSELSFSPNGRRLAFLAGEKGARSLYALDLSGKARLGNLEALMSGRPDPTTRAESYDWDEGKNLPAPPAAADD
jgi:hypothetical protein